MNHKSGVTGGLVFMLALITGCSRGNNQSGFQQEVQVVESSRRIGEPPGGPEDLDAPPLSIRISLAEKPVRERVVVKVTVEATGDRDITWDAEYSVFLEWTIRDQSGNGIPQSRKSGDKVVEMARKRFVTVRSGASITKSINVSERIQRISYGQFFMAPTGVETIKGGEELVRYVISKDTKSIDVRLDYQSGIPLKALFGFDENDVGLAHGRVRSNELHVEFE